MKPDPLCPFCRKEYPWGDPVLIRCPEFKPDHNGECLNCDEWATMHACYNCRKKWRINVQSQSSAK